MAQESESTCVVQLYDHPVYKGEMSVRWTNDISTTFELEGADKWLISRQIKLPLNVNDFQIFGSVTWKHDRAGEKTALASSKEQFVDFTPAIRHLRSLESWGKRMEKFVQELNKIEKQQQDRDESPSELIRANGPVLPESIKSAEQRIKFALPDEHKQLLQDYGAWSYSSSRCVPATDINPANTQMRSIWGSPASEFDSLSEKSKTLYQASVMLFVEGGDGYGALIYHPTSSTGDYYWIHQDNLDEPVKLVDNQNKPRDYSSAMRWIIANQILLNYDDVFDGTFIDRSSTTAFPYQLRLNFPSQKQLETNQLEVRLEVEWSKFD
ncbi:MAG: SMI1/KNR4 family protein [Pirellulaceae bacterium]|nr:SMI1/KNR4 family protein [Pirellulaceae bacterium]